MTAHWLWFDGIEVANPDRLRAYVNLKAPEVDTSAFCEACATGTLGPAYTDPATDPAPWHDPATPASADYLGAFITRSGGLDDSMRAANVIQLLTDGGAITGLRHETREFRFSMVLVGASWLGVEAGSEWLDAILERGRTDSSCTGGVQMEWLSDCASNDPVIRQARSVRATYGPSVIGEQSGALYYRRVEFTTVSPSPRIFMPEVPQLAWVGSSQEVRRSGVVVNAATKAVCANIPGPPETVQDPSSPLPTPPTSPTTPPPPGSTATYNVTKTVFLPAGMSPSWSAAALSIRIHAPAGSAVEDVRVRVIEQVDPADTLATADACDLGGEFYVSYIPAGYSVEIDGAERIITGMTASGGDATMSHLVSSSVPDSVMQWPLVKAGRAAWVVVDSGSTVGLTIDASSVVR